MALQTTHEAGHRGRHVAQRVLGATLLFEVLRCETLRLSHAVDGLQKPHERSELQLLRPAHELVLFAWHYLTPSRRFSRLYHSPPALNSGGRTEKSAAPPQGRRSASGGQSGDYGLVDRVGVLAHALGKNCRDIATQ